METIVLVQLLVFVFCIGFLFFVLFMFVITCRDIQNNVIDFLDNFIIWFKASYRYMKWKMKGSSDLLIIDKANNYDYIPPQFTGKVIFRNCGSDIGYQFFKNGMRHSAEGPAIIFWELGLPKKHFYLYDTHIENKEKWFSLLSEEEKEKALWNTNEWA